MTDCVLGFTTRCVDVDAGILMLRISTTAADLTARSARTAVVTVRVMG